MTAEVKLQFPGLDRKINGHPLVYLDNAASTQVPERVLAAMSDYYREGHANVDRGVHELGQRATRIYEDARGRVAEFMGAHREREIVFVRGTTEAANLVAQAFLAPRLGAGDRVVVTEMEHHSNFLPWYEACRSSGAQLDIVPVGPGGELDGESLHRMLEEPGCKFLAITHASNVLGTVNQIPQLVSVAHRNGVRVFVDGAQAVPHFRVDMADLGCDFYAFSGHKIHGPTGIGVLYGREEILEDMPPWQTGGGMVMAIDGDVPAYKSPPSRFEAGTPNIMGAVGISEAVSFLQDCRAGGVQRQEEELLEYLDEKLGEQARVQVLAASSDRVGVVSFVYEGVHAHDVGSILDSNGVAVRVGHHCAIPLMQRLGVPATVRISLACHNTRADVDALVQALDCVDTLFPWG